MFKSVHLKSYLMQRSSVLSFQVENRQSHDHLLFTTDMQNAINRVTQYRCFQAVVCLLIPCANTTSSGAPASAQMPSLIFKSLFLVSGISFTSYEFSHAFRRMFVKSLSSISLICSEKYFSDCLLNHFLLMEREIV